MRQRGRDAEKFWDSALKLAKHFETIDPLTQAACISASRNRTAEMPNGEFEDIGGNFGKNLSE